MLGADSLDCASAFNLLFGPQADKEIELEKEIARGNQLDRKMLIEESFLHANSQKPVRLRLAHLLFCRPAVKKKYTREYPAESSV